MSLGFAEADLKPPQPLGLIAKADLVVLQPNTIAGFPLRLEKLRQRCLTDRTGLGFTALIVETTLCIYCAFVQPP